MNVAAASQVPAFDDTPIEPGALARALTERLTVGLGVPLGGATLADWYQAIALTLRDELFKRWHRTNQAIDDGDLKQVAYLSMEFLPARELENALHAVGGYEAYREALARFGIAVDEVIDLERDPGLGNGGLGRLAACYMDSAACLGVPCTGYGIRYEYGMFRQTIVDGWQVEKPDDWLDVANPWEIARPQRVYRVRTGGRVEHRGHAAHWVDTEDVFAVAYDTLVPGHGQGAVNTLRLWSVKPAEAFDLSAFNRGAHMDALATRIRSKTLSRVLYPDDSTEQGRELRLRQEHFFVSASMQDILARFRARHRDWAKLPAKFSVHLNDTHPALAPVELMRLLVDEHRLEWDAAWELIRRTFSYTNHTLMPEALEVWPGGLMRRVLPRHHEIIEEINRRFLAGLFGRQDRLELIHHDSGAVNMGRLSVVASHRVNGVSKLHSRLVKESLFADFVRLDPERFCNVTNGITPRRWLFQANPALCALIDEALGAGWRDDLPRLAELRRLAGDARFRQRMIAIKRHNKGRLSDFLKRAFDVDADPDAMVDVQIKRIHEYKRQLLNLLGVLARARAIKADPQAGWPPRLVIMAGKAASAYWMAKLVIKLAHDVARYLEADPLLRGRLRLVFVPNYSVSIAQRIIPAADVSQQISLAGTEASGTSNMKLAINGAVALCTDDGANIEIADAVGRENVFGFGMRASDVARTRASGYDPHRIYEQDEAVRGAIDLIAGGALSPDEPDRFRAIVDSLLVHGDPFFVLADFASYWQAQQAIDRAWGDQDEWAARLIHTIAGMGGFSSDRAVDEYARRIWGAARLPAAARA